MRRERTRAHSGVGVAKGRNRKDHAVRPSGSGSAQCRRGSSCPDRRGSAGQPVAMVERPQGARTIVRQGRSVRAGKDTGRSHPFRHQARGDRHAARNYGIHLVRDRPRRSCDPADAPQSARSARRRPHGGYRRPLRQTVAVRRQRGHAARASRAKRPWRCRSTEPWHPSPSIIASISPPRWWMDARWAK